MSERVAGGRLVVCPTPIGNLADITLRTLDALRDADVVACEDTRRTRVLLDHHGIRARTVAYHEHNEAKSAAGLVTRIAGGEVVALATDAGMPVVSDPGWVLIEACVAAGLRVEVLPGPSSVLVALALSALPAATWRFVGFLPRRDGPLRALAEDPGVLVAFESPRRLAASLAVLAEAQPDRPAAVCRELTKLHEEAVRGSLAELAARYATEDPRGEIVLVLGEAPARDDADVGAAVDALAELVAAGAKARPAAGVVAGLTGTAPNELYRALMDRPRPKGGRGSAPRA